jgi:hypothetical protein
MPISINGTGTITGLSAGGLPDGSITTDDIASTAITTAKINDAAITTAKINDAAITFAKLSTSATESDNVAKRTAKVWVNFNGSGSIRSSFNVSSVADNVNIGDYTVNYASPLSSADYVIAGTARSSQDNGAMLSLNQTSTPASGSCRVRTLTSTNTYFDPEFVFFLAIN